MHQVSISGKKQGLFTILPECVSRSKIRNEITVDGYFIQLHPLLFKMLYHMYQILAVDQLF